MPVDMSKLEPLLNAAITKITEPGGLSSEYKAATTSGRLGIALFVLGLLATALGPVADAFSGTHLGVWAGIAASIVGALVKLISSVHYVAGRVDVKGSISDVLDSVGTIVKTVADAQRVAPAIASNATLGPPSPSIPFPSQADAAAALAIPPAPIGKLADGTLVYPTAGGAVPSKTP